jgi:hypothetical protein
MNRDCLEEKVYMSQINNDNICKRVDPIHKKKNVNVDMPFGYLTCGKREKHVIIPWQC